MPYTTLTFTRSALETQDIMATVRMVLHRDSPDLVSLIVPRIQARTAVDTGALQSAIIGDPHPDPDDPVLAEFFADDNPQLAAWGRIYVAYQEGGTLGLPTYTNPPRLMFARVETDDLPLIEAWAIDRCQEAIDLCETGAGIPL